MPGKVEANERLRLEASGNGLDPVNLRLLAELHEDPRISMSELGRRVGMSAPAVTDRVRRMEDEGVITGYRMEVSPEALGLPVTALVRIRPVPGQLPKLMALAAAVPSVSECYRITGEDCLIAMLHAGSVQEIEAVLDQFLLYGNTTTSIVVSTPVPRRPLPLPWSGSGAAKPAAGSAKPAKAL